MLLSPPCFSIILCYFLLILVFFFSVDISNDDPIWGKDLSLSVNTSGHILHAFVNGEHIGNFGYGYGFVVSSEIDYYPLLHASSSLHCALISGYQYALLGQFEFQFRRSITLQLGKNEITLLSVTVGLTVSVYTFNLSSILRKILAVFAFKFKFVGLVLAWD